MEGDVNYHTYHGTKGEQYDNVAIIMGHSFGGGYQEKNKFKKYFEHLQLSCAEQGKILEDTKLKEEIYNTRNLVYVASSRAIKNLSILYIDDITEISDGMKSIFGDIKTFQLERI